MMEITSLKNPRVREWRSLQTPKGRRETGCFLAEGRKLTDEALRSGWALEAVLLQQGEPVPERIPPEVPLYVLPPHILEAVCETKTPQGIAAVVRMPEENPRVTEGLWVALDDVQDPGNVGTILRTADAAGFAGALLSEHCADVYSPKVLRATMGSLFRVPAARTENLPETLAQLRERGFSVLCGELGGAPFFARTGVGERAVLVIGNEGNGISPAVLREATHRLALPMRGGAESLNAAVAAGIMMYDMIRAKEED